VDLIDLAQDGCSIQVGLSSLAQRLFSYKGLCFINLVIYLIKRAYRSVACLTATDKHKVKVKLSL
jgi:hypothetical protein